ncbi:MAG TPA: GFA family protein [Xanthobacteraceae bacterium]|jgi:hypothetical protein|nr:GFA family protein [Xanthobacteraceae bacterium]
MSTPTTARNAPAAYPKTASCLCGALRVTASAPPRMVHACSCLDCQRQSGSAFSYSAFFPTAAVTVSGEVRSWRRTSDSGRWQETDFCATCGGGLVSRLEALPGLVCVPVGGFADPDFQAPETLYWASKRHRWLDLPAGIKTVETQ